MFPTRALLGSRPNRADRGLYQGAHVITTVRSSKSQNKSLARLYPNAQPHILYSSVLNQYFRLNVTARALRTIDKKGGLDAYLLTTRDRTVDSIVGRVVKKDIIAELRKRFPENQRLERLDSLLPTMQTLQKQLKAVR